MNQNAIKFFVSKEFFGWISLTYTFPQDKIHAIFDPLFSSLKAERQNAKKGTSVSAKNFL